MIETPLSVGAEDCGRASIDVIFAASTDLGNFRDSKLAIRSEALVAYPRCHAEGGIGWVGR
jgi:hypothetical protein